MRAGVAYSGLTVLVELNVEGVSRARAGDLRHRRRGHRERVAGLADRTQAQGEARHGLLHRRRFIARRARAARGTRLRGLGGTAGLNFVSRAPDSQVGEGSRQGAFSLTVAMRYAHFVGDIAGIYVGEAGNPDTIQVTPTAAKAHEVALHLGVNGIW